MRACINTHLGLHHVAAVIMNAGINDHVHPECSTKEPQGYYNTASCVPSVFMFESCWAVVMLTQQLLHGRHYWTKPHALHIRNGLHVALVV